MYVFWLVICLLQNIHTRALFVQAHSAQANIPQALQLTAVDKNKGGFWVPDWLPPSVGAVLLDEGSVQMAKRLPMLLSDWLVSDVSEDPEMLRSSPAIEVQ